MSADTVTTFPATADAAHESRTAQPATGLPGAAESARSGGTPAPSRGSKIWAAVWPVLVALGLFLAVWEIVYLTGWKPSYVLPSPVTVFGNLGSLTADPQFWHALTTTVTRSIAGFAVAVTIGSVIGIVVSQSKVLRAGVGSLITGLQTMPSIVWFPLAILFFGLTEEAIFFVVVLGAAPSIANGIISGIDHVPPAYRRLGTVLGADRIALYRHIVLPAAMPSYVQGLNQGWAFAWRSLMAGELLVVIEGRPSLGSRLDFAREFGNAPQLMAYMIVIVILGMLANTLFSTASRRMRAKRGLAVD